MPGEGSGEEKHALLSEKDIDAVVRDALSRGYVPLRTPGGNYILPPSDAVTVLQVPGLDPEVRDALLDQLDSWVKLADFAKRLSIGLAIGSGVLTLFILSAMTWNDLFAGSGMWEFSLVLFALTIFIASPLAIFVIGRPLKGVDEWSPTLSAGTRDSVEGDT
jgi:hypothetical protein